MKKKILCKCLLTLGLLLFFTMLLPFTSYNVVTAHAANIEKEKVDYALYVKTITLVKGKSYTLRAKNLDVKAKISFKSDDQEVASVSDDGIITANKVGVAIITATIKDGINTTNLYCEVTVGPPAFSIKVTRSRIILGGIESSDNLRVILKPSNTAEDVGFSSINKSVASISPGGRITAKGVGLTYLYADIDATINDDNRKPSCVVIVTTVADAPLFETYFSEHPELEALADLTKALDEFFNTKYDQKATTSQINSLDRFLNDEFESELKTIRDAIAPTKIPLSQVEVISNNSAK